MIDDSERRTRLAVHHHLAPGHRGHDVAAVARSLVGLHATDPATVYLATAARLGGAPVEVVADALYEHRTVARILGMRRTMFVVPVDLVPAIHAASTRALVATERRRFAQMLEGAGVTDAGDLWLARVEAATLAALDVRGEATATELSEDVPELGLQLAYGEGKRWAGKMGVSGRVLLILGLQEQVVRGRPRGSWTSSQYRWAPMAAWLPEGLASLDPAVARAEVARRWFAGFGPGTVADLKWWTGWTLGQARAAIAAAPLSEVSLAEGPGYVLADDVDPVAPPEPWVALLPALDPTTMGWKQRAWYLGDHGPALFDRSGNAGPTVWSDGRVVGGWGQRPDGEVVVRLLEDVGTEVGAAVGAEAARLTVWHDGTRVTPRFRTPVERELSA